jgi:5'-nucleotidase
VTVLTAGADGRAAATVTIPAGAAAGSHRIELRGVTSGRSLMSSAFTVTAAAAPASLPRTGVPALRVLQAGLVVLGLGLLLSGRSLARRTA